MSNYTKATNFATKDTLPTGNAGKIVKGTEIDDEFNAIASAVSSKADTASPTLTGTPLAPTATAGTNTTQIATTAFVANAILNPSVESVIFEGATADGYETTLVATDPTADRTITFPDKSGTVAMTSEIASAATLVSGSGTYAVAGSSTVTVTITAHGRAVDDVVYLNFTSGTLTDGYFTITAVTTDTFSFNYGSTQTTSGNVTAYYSALGTVSIASSDETVLGTSTTRATTPAGVTAAIYAKFVQGTEQATTSGSSITFSDIPSWVKRITVMFKGVGADTAYIPYVQLGDSGGIETTGYVSQAARQGATDTVTDSTAGFYMYARTDASTANGVLYLNKFNSTTWIANGIISPGTDGTTNVIGSKELTGTLTQLKISASTGAFTAGAINILYE